ncbi:DUF1801 domain-containing protein [Salibacteraceae bacterium]|mgnify:CR=1 FL=1|jgi:uncharacterized protein YdeI (YjbR/CyaY-like superfamily)|nr:DUF1801 domain-containing protein [Salibacteraceae bacterium]MDB4105671.1 DUF1801 domain-containing protein [Salibacteraceae bacterium]MDC1220211.1 DUF1801 domain-containing protein [bacterium]MDC1304035.1 DUF1801 domain-containing protein [Salibacteraceae bacterium]HAQ72338.1 hypothetical protein [Flavobacteriales bacterium]
MIRADSVEGYIEQSEWKEELILLRKLILETSLEETIKWGAPCYTLNGKNVLGLASFKSYVGLWFHNGVFLKDSADRLIQASDKTKALRQWRFHNLKEINPDEVRLYILEAIQNQELGKEIKSTSTPLSIPQELNLILKNNSQLKFAFEELSSGKQKEYAEYISIAKRLETKNSRCEKIIPMILSGIGLNDQYR